MGRLPSHARLGLLEASSSAEKVPGLRLKPLGLTVSVRDLCMGSTSPRRAVFSLSSLFLGMMLKNSALMESTLVAGTSV